MAEKAKLNVPEESAQEARTERAVPRREASEGAVEADQEADIEAAGGLDAQQAQMRDRNMDLLLKAFQQHLTRRSHEENETRLPKTQLRRTDH